MKPTDCFLQLLLTESICRGSPERIVRDAIAGGVDLIQLREKDLSTRKRLEQARRILEIAEPEGVPILINDDVEVAARLPVAGVHLGQQDCPVEEARRRLGETAWIGWSTHSFAEAMVAQKSGATHLGLGSCFATSTKPEFHLLPPEELAKSIQASTLPIYAIGGIRLDNVAALVRLGVKRVAVSATILTSADPAATAAALRDALAM